MKVAQLSAFPLLRRVVRAVAGRVGDAERERARYLINLRFEFRIGPERHQAFSRDLSATGVFLHTDHPVPPGTEITLCFKIPGNAPPIRCAGVVRHRRDDPEGPPRQGIGVEFGPMSPRDERRLRRFLDQQDGVVDPPDPD